MKIEHHINLQAHNTMGLPCVVDALFTVEDASDYATLAKAIAALPTHTATFILGSGSNVILPANLRGMVIKIETRGITKQSEDADTVTVSVQAGEPWHDFVLHCVAQGWHGLENLAYIPGTVGAAPMQNIGAYGTEVCECIASVNLCTLDLQLGQAIFSEISGKNCEFSYRDSIFKRSAPQSHLVSIITAVVFRLSKIYVPKTHYGDLQKYGEITSAAQMVAAVTAIRKAKLPDPAEIGNAGSFFKNPVVSATQCANLLALHPTLPHYAQTSGEFKLAAAWLIERCGFKGKRYGAVGMHAKQALVLVNYGEANADAVWGLANVVLETVQQKFGVRLEAEPVRVAAV